MNKEDLTQLINVSNVNEVITDRTIPLIKLAETIAGSSFKIGYGERTTAEGTGTEDFTCGFEPQLIFFIGMNCDTRDSGNSYGFSDGTDNYAMYWNSSAIGFIGGQDTNRCVDIREYNTANKCDGHVTATSSTGFTLTWDTVGNNGKYIWLAIS